MIKDIKLYDKQENIIVEPTGILTSGAVLFGETLHRGQTLLTLESYISLYTFPEEGLKDEYKLWHGDLIEWVDDFTDNKSISLLYFDKLHGWLLKHIEKDCELENMDGCHCGQEDFRVDEWGVTRLCSVFEPQAIKYITKEIQQEIITLLTNI